MGGIHSAPKPPCTTSNAGVRLLLLHRTEPPVFCLRASFMAWTGNAMCSHKRTTIVHQHLYNIKGAIYKSTAIVHRMVMAGEPRPPVLCGFSTGEHSGSCHKAGGGSVHLWACRGGGSRAARTPQGQSSLESGFKSARSACVQVSSAG